MFLSTKREPLSGTLYQWNVYLSLAITHVSWSVFKRDIVKSCKMKYYDTRSVINKSYFSNSITFAPIGTHVFILMISTFNFFINFLKVLQ